MHMALHSSKCESILIGNRHHLCTVHAMAPPTIADIPLPLSETITIHQAWSHIEPKFNLQ